LALLNKNSTIGFRVEVFKLKGLRSSSRKPLSPHHLKPSFRNTGMPLHWVPCMTGGQADLQYVLSWVMPGSQSFTVYVTDLYAPCLVTDFFQL